MAVSCRSCTLTEAGIRTSIRGARTHHTAAKNDIPRTIPACVAYASNASRHSAQTRNASAETDFPRQARHDTISAGRVTAGPGTRAASTIHIYTVQRALSLISDAVFSVIVTYHIRAENPRVFSMRQIVPLAAAVRAHIRPDPSTSACPPACHPPGSPLRGFWATAQGQKKIAAAESATHSEDPSDVPAMMRPVITRRDTGAKPRQPSLGLGSVFRNIADSFRTPAHARHRKLPIVINPTVVGGTSNQQELFARIRSASLAVRSQAVLELANAIEEFSISSVPEIWYAARDLLPARDADLKARCLALLLSCIRHDDLDSPAIRMMYYHDVVTLCELDPGAQHADPDFKTYLQCLDVLTAGGARITDCNSHRDIPLSEFLSDSIASLYPGALASPELETVFRDLLTFTGGCITKNPNMFDDDCVAAFARQAIRQCISCPSRPLVRHLVQFIQMLIAQGLPLAAIPELTTLSCYLYSIERALSWEIITSLLSQPLYGAAVMVEMCTLLAAADTHAHAGVTPEVRLTISICTAEVLTRVLAEGDQFGVAAPAAELIFGSLDAAAAQQDETLDMRLVVLTRELLRSNPAAYVQYFLEKGSVLDSMEKIMTRPHRSGDPEEVLMEIFAILTSVMQQDELVATDAIIKYYISHSRLLREADFEIVLKHMSSALVFSSLYDSAGETAVMLMSIAQQVRPASDGIKTRCLEVICDYFVNSFEDSEPGHVSLPQLLQQMFASYHEDPEIVERVLARGFLMTMLVRLDTPAESTDFEQALTCITEFVAKNRASSKLVDILCETFVAAMLTTNDPYKAIRLFETLNGLARDALRTGRYKQVLSISKLFVRLRINASSAVYITDPSDIEGLTAAFNRNSIYTETPDTNLAWTYPESLAYIPPDLIGIPSKVFKSVSMDAWLSVVVEIMDNFYDWELYSFIWSHFCPQLSNTELFASENMSTEATDTIFRLTRVIIKNLSSQLPTSLVFPEGLTKADLQIAIIRTLTALIAYHNLLYKSDEDALIVATIDGLSTSWEKTAIPAIHFLNLACYEIPLSVKKYLSAILIKLQTRISSFFASPHILEFLMALSHLPSLSSSFTLDEYKRIFGISFQFIEFYKINKSGAVRHEDEVFVNRHGEDVKVGNVPSTELINITPALSQYLLRLSYSVISSWFLSMKVPERAELAPFIVRNLTIISKVSEGEEPDDQTVGFLDFISRFTLNDSDLKMSKSLKKHPGYNATRWLCDNAVISVMTKDDDCMIHVRKPADSVILKMARGASDKAQLHDGLEWLLKLDKDAHPVLHYVFPEQTVKRAVRLPDTTSVQRSLDNLDRLPVVQFVKAGIMYIGPMQSKEGEILANQFGSEKYQNFLSKVGHLVRLQNCDTVYTGGLDTENDTDGKFAIIWTDKITQLVFHTTTLMPNGDSANDPNMSLKKKHVGNNHVNIYFVENGLPFDFNVIRSQFNFINIVVSPVSPGYYRVKVFRRNGIPPIFAACHFKLISENRLATFVRNLTLVCYEFSDVWDSEGQFIGNWSRRSQHIKRLWAFCTTSEP